MTELLRLDVDLEWTEAAACCGEDPERFFPDTQAMDDPDVQAALAVCTDCPVRTACLDWALAYEAFATTRFGIFGGMTPRQRTALVRPRKQRGEGQHLGVQSWAVRNGVPVLELGTVSNAVRRAYAEATYGRSESA